MNIKYVFPTLVVLTLCLSTGGAIAYEHAAERPAVAASHPKDLMGGKKALAAHNAKTQKVPKSKLVDINSAKKPALKKLPGISDVEADKIIAGRPYASKTWLVTNKVIEPATYASIKDLLIAKQPFKTAAENVAFYDKLKKEKAAKP